MTATLLDLESGVTDGNATVRYNEILTPLAEGDTIGITVGKAADMEFVDDSILIPQRIVVKRCFAYFSFHHF